MLTPDGYCEKRGLTCKNMWTIKQFYRSIAYWFKPPNFLPKAPIQFQFAELNPRPHGGSDRGFGGCVIFCGGIGEPPNRQGAALVNQGIDLLNHSIVSKTVPRVRLELARRGW